MMTGEVAIGYSTSSFLIMCSLTHALCLTQTHTHPLSLSHTHTHALSFFLSNTHILTHSPLYPSPPPPPPPRCSVVMPEQISYSDNATVPPNITISQLGPAVDVSFLIRSTGPSRIANIQLVISWPLNSTVTRDNYYLYVTSVQVKLYGGSLARAY